MTRVSGKVLRHRRLLGGVSLGVGAGLGLSLLVLTGGVGLLYHWGCAPSGIAANDKEQIPALLLNSPFGGTATGDVVLPAGYLSPFETIIGTSSFNGSAVWGGYNASVTVWSVHSVRLAGPGLDRGCTGPFALAIQPLGGTSAGIQLLGPGNATDAAETSTLFPGSSDVYFSNGFVSPTESAVTTCGGPSTAIQVNAMSLSLAYRFSFDGRNISEPLDVPLVGAHFEYTFPANFGSWQIDNLSAPGGPGGGWAFSYSPCP